jgi:2-amino-4-hydroxy-6-hydroxymethyldihydropteridine diphosphokinase
VNRLHNIAYLSLGSNLGDRAANLKAAIGCLSAEGIVLTVSSFYETEPVEFTAQPWFLNCTLKFDTEKSPKELLTALLVIEQEMGRKRKQEKGPRVLDIDILLFEDCIVDTAELTIPHPSMHERRFVLEPLAEIAPEVCHPVLNRTILELRDALPSGQAIRKIPHSAPEA